MVMLLTLVVLFVGYWVILIHLASYTILEGLESEIMPQSSAYVLNTTEEIQEFMEWEEKLLKKNMGLPKKNC